MSDVIATNVRPGDDLLTDIFASIKGAGAAVQNVTNQWAALQAQNDDIANQRWTLNNAAYQFQQMTPFAQLALAAAAAWMFVSLVKKG
jgi:hypothetical protein